MAQKEVTKYAVKYLLGKCLPSSKQNAVKVRIPRLVFDERLNMYFKDFEFVYAHDPKKCCKTGDTVLVQNLPKKLTRIITHEIVDIIYPLGDVTDPITGKKVVGEKYREDIEKVTKLYGELSSTFDYNKAAPRGRLEDKRDFSHKKTYIKYHEDPDIPQPYGINP